MIEFIEIYIFFYSKLFVMDFEIIREKFGMFYDVKLKNDVLEIG